MSVREKYGDTMLKIQDVLAAAKDLEEDAENTQRFRNNWERLR